MKKLLYIVMAVFSISIFSGCSEDLNGWFNVTEDNGAITKALIDQTIASGGLADANGNISDANITTLASAVLLQWAGTKNPGLPSERDLKVPGQYLNADPMNIYAGCNAVFIKLQSDDTYSYSLYGIDPLNNPTVKGRDQTQTRSVVLVSEANGVRKVKPGVLDVTNCGLSVPGDYYVYGKRLVVFIPKIIIKSSYGYEVRVIDNPLGKSAKYCRIQVFYPVNLPKDIAEVDNLTDIADADFLKYRLATAKDSDVPDSDETAVNTTVDGLAFDNTYLDSNMNNGGVVSSGVADNSNTSTDGGIANLLSKSKIYCSTFIPVGGTQGQVPVSTISHIRGSNTKKAQNKSDGTASTPAEYEWKTTGKATIAATDYFTRFLKNDYGTAENEATKVVWMKYNFKTPGQLQKFQFYVRNIPSKGKCRVSVYVKYDVEGYDFYFPLYLKDEVTGLLNSVEKLVMSQRTDEDGMLTSTTYEFGFDNTVAGNAYLQDYYSKDLMAEIHDLLAASDNGLIQAILPLVKGNEYHHHRRVVAFNKKFKEVVFRVEIIGKDGNNCTPSAYGTDGYLYPKVATTNSYAKKDGYFLFDLDEARQIPTSVIFHDMYPMIKATQCNPNPDKDGKNAFDEINDADGNASEIKFTEGRAIDLLFNRYTSVSLITP